MASGLNQFIGPLYDELDTFNRESTGFIAGAELDTSLAGGAIGQELSAPVGNAGKVVSVVEGVSPNKTDTSSVESAVFKVERSEVVPIMLSGESAKGLRASGNNERVMRTLIQDAYRTLSNRIETYMAEKAVAGASRAVGKAGTTPFGTSADLMDFANLAKILDENGCPKTERTLVLSGAAMANLRGKQTILTKVNESGSAEFLRTGYTAPVMNFRIFDSQGLDIHAAGAGTGYLLNGDAVAGSRELAIDTGSGLVKAGDTFSIAGDDRIYVVNKDMASGDTVLSIGRPGLKVAAADNAALTFGSAYVPSVGFHKKALVLGTRTIADPDTGDSCDDRTLVTDPVTGITFDVRLYKEYHRSWLEIGIAYGAAVMKPENVVLLLG